MSLPRRRIAGKRFERFGRSLCGRRFSRRLGDAGLFGTVFAGDFARHRGRLGANHLTKQLVDRNGSHRNQGDHNHVFDQLIKKLAYPDDL